MLVKATLLASDEEENRSQTFQFQVRSHVTIPCCLKNTCPLKRIITYSSYSKISRDKRIKSVLVFSRNQAYGNFKCEMAQKKILKEFSLLYISFAIYQQVNMIKSSHINYTDYFLNEVQKCLHNLIQFIELGYSFIILKTSFIVYFTVYVNSFPTIK